MNTAIEFDEVIVNGIFADDVTQFRCEDLPPFRRIRFSCSFGANSYIRNELWLPEEWNGIFLGCGNGGIAGEFDYPPLADGLKKGYAVAQTDMGTYRLKYFNEYNRDVFYEYGVRSTHAMTVVSKEFINNHYGKKPEYSYFFGSSAGGIQAFSEATNFPEDYDGIIAGVPSVNALFLITWFLWRFMCFYGNQRREMFESTDGRIITECVVEYFQSLGDGEKGDDFVSNPYFGEDTVDKVLSYIAEKHPEFSSEQLETLRKLYNGPVNPETGEQIFPGFSVGAERYSGGFGDNDDYFGYPWYKCFFGKDFDEYTFDFSSHLEEMLKGEARYLCASKTDFSEFNKNGGKMIFYSGTADPAGPYGDAMKHYNRICERNGGYENASHFIKCFILPGKEHGDCGRGVNKIFAPDGVGDIIDTIRAWVEKDSEPEYIIGAHIRRDDGTEKFRRNIYPYKADKKEGIDFPRCTADRYLDMVSQD